MKKSCFLLVLLVCCAYCNAQLISTIAGNGTSSDSGDGGPATNAGIANPLGMCFDRHGNLFFADDLGNCIRKIGTNGIIETVAGTGSPGYNGDNILAITAELKYPESVIVDSAGNLYIADLGNNRIRQVDFSTGIIKTIVGTGVNGFSGDGGPATAAMIYQPTDLCFDKHRNLYITDCVNYRVRKIDPSGIISTYAGIGTSGSSGDNGPATNAQFILINGIKADASNNLYIADWNGGKIRKINASGLITTIAGTGMYSYNGDNIPATNANLTPIKIVLNERGEIFIVDGVNNRIRKVNDQGTISTIAGNGTAGFLGDGGPATGAELNRDGGIAIDSCDNVYIAEVNNFRIRKIAITPLCVPLAINMIKEDEVNTYPNPTNDQLQVDNITTPTNYSLLSIVGATLQHGVLKEGKNTLSLNALHTGMYLLELIDEEGNKTLKKIIKE